ncbi:hypothetical protein BD309DRAFT_992335 [Dichomitus squalens]|uniref:Uncharacterized protein n=2 Tax=Dichomitus squalens TaxID=114155 RepID=A0A4Q9PKS0_9APHY|nr:uncharacterized protein DICSQDRAFT_175238 [Dichomitus squalens LYAD-421 SS1]EJF56084.1 hypothetical protein DICSQDRAFT_175238 [Dichomitus squalens LYAD-421 SS1]TBU41512.1 hypothetical protein BD309DRAFT_992335 [Dichomitus squalens]TBU54741.1 hypothetical protein BD310DRAFT_980135 [Dichomitus squalens]
MSLAHDSGDTTEVNVSLSGILPQLAIVSPDVVMEEYMNGERPHCGTSHARNSILSADRQCDLQGPRPPGLPVPDHGMQERPANPSPPGTPPKLRRKRCLDCHHAEGPRTLRQRRLDYLRDMCHIANPSGGVPELPPLLRLDSSPQRCDWTIDCGTIGAWRKCPIRQLATYAQHYCGSSFWLAAKRDDLYRVLQEREAKKRGYDVALYTTPMYPDQTEMIVVEDADLMTY